MNFLVKLILTTFILASCSHKEDKPLGSIDREQVRLAVKTNLGEFKNCYDSEYRKDEKLEGKVVVIWEVQDNGEARNARIDAAKTTLNNDEVKNCILNTMLKIKFPLPSKGTIAEITYPFLFLAGKKE